MFAKVAKPQTKAAEVSASGPTPLRSTLEGHRLGYDPVEQEVAAENTTAREALSWDFGKIPLFPPHRAYRPQPSSRLATTPLPGIMQAKLAVGQVNDPLEHEANRVADQVMRMTTPAPAVTPSRLRISRKCAAEEDGLVQPKSAEACVDAVGHAPPIVHDVVQSPGRPLDLATRNFFEPRFGHDLSSVRVHTDAQADASAQAINAIAYTVGQNIVFGAGQFAPHQSDGRKLIAHELAHVVQQRRPEDARAGQENCEQDAENAAHSIGSGIAPMVRTGAVFGAVQRQPSAVPIAGPAAQKKSRLVRIERYWRSTSARAFFADGSNEEVTFVDTISLDGDSRPEGTLEKVVKLTIDRSSPIRPHVERASGTSGSNVKVVTRLSPADRISRLPAKVRGEVSEAFLGDTENESDPETMEFAADMGERLKETSGTTKIEMEGRDPATVETVKAVDQWVSEQKSSLDKVGAMHRAKFTHLLNDIRQVGVTGAVAAEDLNAEDIELVLAGAAGGQSEFQTFDEFKRGMTFKLRSGRISLPEEHADNPDFVVRNEYRKAWKAEAAGLRKMSRIAAAAQVAPFLAVGASAVAGAGLAGAEAFVAGLVARGVAPALIGKWVGTSLVASSVVSHFGSARDEARAAGSDPNSAKGLVSTASAAFLRGIGIGEVAENITNTSMQKGEPLKRSPLERVVGGAGGALNMLGMSDMFVPEAPSGLPAAAKTGGAKAGIENADTTAGADPATSFELPDPAAQPVAQGTAISKIAGDAPKPTVETPTSTAGGPGAKGTPLHEIEQGGETSTLTSAKGSETKVPPTQKAEDLGGGNARAGEQEVTARGEDAGKGTGKPPKQKARREDVAKGSGKEQAGRQDKAVKGEQARKGTGKAEPETSVWVQLQDGTVREYQPSQVKGQLEQGSAVTTAEGNGVVIRRGEEAPQSSEVTHQEEPAAQQQEAAAQRQEREMRRFASRVGLNYEAATTQQLLTNLAVTVEDFIGRFRLASIRSVFPREFLGMTVRDALLNGGSTVRKLLTDGRFAK